MSMSTCFKLHSHLIYFSQCKVPLKLSKITQHKGEEMEALELLQGQRIA